MQFLDEMMCHDIMGLFGSFFDNEPIEGRNCAINEIFDLSIVNVAPEEATIIFNLQMKEFATFTIALDLELRTARVVAYADEDLNCVFLDSDIGGLCGELVKNRLAIALSFYDDNFEPFEDLFENVEAFEFDSEVIVKSENEDECKIRLVPSKEKKLISVDFGMGALITKLVDHGIVTMFSCTGHGDKDRYSYMTMYCTDDDVIFVKEKINECFEPKNIKTEQDSSYWLPLDDGRKHYYFNWK